MKKGEKLDRARSAEIKQKAKEMKGKFTQREIAAKLGVCHGRVWQILNDWKQPNRAKIIGRKPGRPKKTLQK